MFGRTTKRLSATLVIALGLLLASPLVKATWACPMCQAANEASGDARPRAYMYSIIFMLTMPALIFSGFGVAFYRMTHRIQSEESEDLTDDGGSPPAHHIC